MMSSVLVDTSVWVAHFREHNESLARLLLLDFVVIHPLVIGELACGTPPGRQQTLADLASLRTLKESGMESCLAFIEKNRLYGLGCGWIDLMLLFSALETSGVQFWTLDKRLHALAQRFSIAYQG